MPDNPRARLDELLAEAQRLRDADHFDELRGMLAALDYARTRQIETAELRQLEATVDMAAAHLRAVDDARERRSADDAVDRLCAARTYERGARRDVLQAQHVVRTERAALVFSRMIALALACAAAGVLVNPLMLIGTLAMIVGSVLVLRQHSAVSRELLSEHRSNRRVRVTADLVHGRTRSARWRLKRDREVHDEKLTELLQAEQAVPEGVAWPELPPAP